MPDLRPAAARDPLAASPDAVAPVPPAEPAAESFPRQQARTRGFRLGAPSAFTPSADGRRVVFVRSGSGTDPVGRLWVVDVADNGELSERCVVDPAALLVGPEDLPAAERARRERLREGGGGITGYATDRDVTVAAFVLSGVPYIVALAPTADGRSAPVREVPAPGPVVDPRPDPTGRFLAYASGGGLYVVDLAARPASSAEDASAESIVAGPESDPSTGQFMQIIARAVIRTTPAGLQRALCPPEGGTVAWGLADFVAAEELDRYRGFWWLADGSGLLVERYDEAPVATWWIADPAAPDREPRSHRYPAAGAANADVSLWLVRLDRGPATADTTAAGSMPSDTPASAEPPRVGDGSATRRAGRSGDALGSTRLPVAWDAAEFPYLTTVSVTTYGQPVIALLTRDQRRQLILEVDPTTGATTVLRERTDPHWVDVVPGVPTRAPGGGLLEVVVDAKTDTYRLVLNDEPLSPPDLQVRAVLDVSADAVVIQAGHDPLIDTAQLLSYAGNSVSMPSGSSMSTARRAGPLVVTSATDRDRCNREYVIWRDWPAPGTGQAADGPTRLGEIRSLAEQPPSTPRVHLLRAGARNLVTAVLFPTGHVPGSRRLPVVLAPYGGPHAQRVVSAGLAYGRDQWLADQGFVVVIADGRGTPGRGPSWDRAVSRDLAGPVLDDQIAALHEAAATWPDDVDLTRVGIHGWSFGGYLAALAVLRRPDVFHAAVAGAPVTDWRLYDTAYTERYLGDPTTDLGPYDACSLLPLAAGLTRPLMLIHGLADDNVAAAHTLQLSGRLLAAGRPHTVLPLTGVSHMTPQEDVAENLLLLQVQFLLEHLAERRT